MNANELQGEREAFEAAMRDRYNCTDYSFVRAPDGYVHAVGHRSMRMTYASVQMLWETFQAGRASLRASTQPAVSAEAREHLREARDEIRRASMGFPDDSWGRIRADRIMAKLDAQIAAMAPPADNKESGNG